AANGARGRCEESTTVRSPLPPRVAWWEGVGVGGAARARDEVIFPPPPTPPHRSQELAGEGSGEAVLTSRDQQQAMERCVSASARKRGPSLGGVLGPGFPLSRE